MRQNVELSWPELLGPPPQDETVDLAERLTRALSEPEVLRVLSDEIEARVRPTHWALMLGDRDTLRVTHVGGFARTSLLHARFLAGAGPLRRDDGVGCAFPADAPVFKALQHFEVQVVQQPAPESLVSYNEDCQPLPEDAVVFPFGGYEVMGCLEMVNLLRHGPCPTDLAALRKVLRLGGVGIRNARRHAALVGDHGVDAITGLAGPNRFRELVQREVERSARSQRPWTVLLVDIDHFHDLNQRLGRLVGHSVLAEMGGLLQANLRRIDRASRWVGDTFAVLLPETNPTQAQVVAQRLQTAIRNHTFIDDEEVGPMTASVGLVDGSEGADLEQSLLEAETALRHAQAEGVDEALVLGTPIPNRAQMEDGVGQGRSWGTGTERALKTS